MDERIVALKWLVQVLGVAFILLGAHLGAKVKRKLAASVKLKAVIKGYNVSGTPSATGKIVRYFSPIYEFEHEGKKYTKEADIKTEKQPYSTGKEVNLYFNPKTKEITAKNEIKIAVIMLMVPIVVGFALLAFAQFGINI